MTEVATITSHLNELLEPSSIEDYPGSLNGLQMSSDANVTRIAAAVDFSQRTLDACVALDANFLIVHHGMFWGGAAAFTGNTFRRLKLLVEKGIAVYSSHLPLDMHPEIGNNVLLATELGLSPSRGFAHWKDTAIGVAGDCNIPTPNPVERASIFASRYGGSVVSTSNCANRVTTSWGLCTGSGASGETLAEAREKGIDTLIVGEGPHWTAVAAEDQGIAVIYAGHYATETLGVQAAAKAVSMKFGIPWSFISAPTGL